MHVPAWALGGTFLLVLALLFGLWRSRRETGRLREGLGFAGDDLEACLLYVWAPAHVTHYSRISYTIRQYGTSARDSLVAYIVYNPTG